MKRKSQPESVEKRASLKKIGGIGVSSVVTTGALSGGWIQPVVAQVELPDHAVCTNCPEPEVAAVLQPCSGNGPAEVTISSPTGCPIQIDSVPTLSVTPATSLWGLDPNAPSPPPVPATVTDVDTYFITFAGPVGVGETATEDCYPPVTDTPLNDPQLLTSMVVTFSWTCVGSGEQMTTSVDILGQLNPPFG